MVMDNRRYFYLAEGECEEKLLEALQLKPSLIHHEKVEKYNIIQDELPKRKLMQYPSGCVVVLVFDTDKDVTEHLKRNLELLKSLPFKVEVMTIVEVLNFEDELERSTDVKHAQDFTKSESLKDFKNAVNRAKDKDFRAALKRHKFDLSKLWTQKPPRIFSFINQDGGKVKVTE